jgi:hypothetical protein
VSCLTPDADTSKDHLIVAFSGLLSAEQRGASKDLLQWSDGYCISCANILFSPLSGVFASSAEENAGLAARNGFSTVSLQRKLKASD